MHYFGGVFEAVCWRNGKRQGGSRSPAALLVAQPCPRRPSSWDGGRSQPGCPIARAIPLSASPLNGGGREREGAEDEWVGGETQKKAVCLGWGRKHIEALMEAD